MSNRRALTFGAWSGVIALVIWLILLWPLTHYIPPPSPMLSVQEVANLYQHNSVGIRIAAMLMLFAISFTIVFYGAISAQLRRIEGAAPIWTYVQMLAGQFSLVGFVTIAVLWSAAAYRAERSPEIISALHDVSWFLYAIVAPPAGIQFFALAFAILEDAQPRPLLPRWYAYLSLWTGVAFLPGVVAAMFKSGPFAWNGLFAFWIPIGTFSLWIFVTTWVLLEATRRTDYVSAHSQLQP